MRTKQSAREDGRSEARYAYARGDPRAGPPPAQSRPAQSGGANLSRDSNSSSTTISSSPVTGPSAAPASATPGPVKQSDETTIPAKRARDSESHEPQKRVKRDYTDTITVLVGDERQKFVVHKNKICKVSTFFATVCSVELGEGQGREVVLADQSPLIFSFYFDRVYSDQLNKQNLAVHSGAAKAEGDPYEPSAFVRTAQITDGLCRLSILADFLGDAVCKGACMKGLLSYSSNNSISTLFSGTVAFIANKAAKDSGIFKWMVDDLAKDLTGDHRSAEKGTKAFAGFPTVVKDELLAKALNAVRQGDKLQVMGNQISKYLDEDGA